MSQNIGDEFSSDEVTVYKDEGESECAQNVGENFAGDKVELIKEAEQVKPVPEPTPRSAKEPSLIGLERGTPANVRSINNLTHSLFEGAGSLSPSTAGLFSPTGPYAALLSASRLAGALSPATIGLLAQTQNASSPGPLGADALSALMGVASPPAHLAAAVAARSSPALAALQIAAALHPYSRSNTTTPATANTPGLPSGAGDQLANLAAVALAAAQSPPVWGTAANSNSSAASNWLYAAGAPSLASGPVGGGISSPGLAASPAASLLARLSPALSTLTCLASAAGLQQSAHQSNPAASLLFNAIQANNQHASPSATNSFQSSISQAPGTNDNATLATEVMLLRAAMAQQQQHHQQQQQQQQQQFASILDAAQQMMMGQQQQQGTPTNCGANAPVTPRSKQITIPTPTSRPRPQPSDPVSTPLAGTIAGAKRPLHGLAHQTTIPDSQHHVSQMLPINMTQSFHHQQQQHVQQSPIHHPHHHHQQQHPSAFSALDPRRQAHIVHQQQQHMGLNMAQHHLNRQSQSPSHNSNEPHVKKPLNAFMLFMKEQRAQVIAECTLKESAAINQILGQRWHNLSRDEQARYYDLAKAEKERHQQLYPNWSARENYASHAKKKKRRKLVNIGSYPSGSSGGHITGAMGADGGVRDPRDAALKKCRARYGVDQMEKWCKPCRRKKKCARYYNLPGADDDNELSGSDAKGTPTVHRSMAGGMMSGMNPMGSVHPFSQSGNSANDDWSDSGSSIGDSEDDEEQLNAFHLVTESSSASSTPSPSPAVMAPLSPTSSIHSSASHHHHMAAQRHLPIGYMPHMPTVKMAPGTPTSSVSGPIMLQQQGSELLYQQPQQRGGLVMPPEAHQLQPINYHSSLQTSSNDSSGTGVVGQPLPSSSSSSSETLPVQQLPSTPPPSTSTAATAQQHLCSPNSSTNAGIPYRPLLPAN